MSVTIAIIEQVSATEVIVKCARCDGTGRKWPNSVDSDPCWICNGRGKLLLQVERLPLVPCNRCEGSGKKWPSSVDSDECMSCGGAGCQPIAGEMRIVK